MKTSLYTIVIITLVGACKAAAPTSTAPVPAPAHSTPADEDKDTDTDTTGPADPGDPVSGHGEFQLAPNDVERAAIEAWFRDKDAGNIRLTEALFVDCRPASPAEFTAFLMHDPGTGARGTLFQFHDYTPMIAFEAEGMCGSAPGAVRVVTVSTGAPPPGCVPQDGLDCEGYEWIDFAFDENGTIVALHVTAAG